MYTWCKRGCILKISVYDNDRDITEDIRLLVKDMSNITEHEKTLIQIKFGIDI